MKRWLFRFVGIPALLSSCQSQTAFGVPEKCLFDSGTLLSFDATPSTPTCNTNGRMSKYSVSRPLGFYQGDAIPEHMAYLTFDDGPSDWTADFLDILKAKGVRATFFVNAMNTKKDGFGGWYIDANGKKVFYHEILKRQVEEGHVLGNHTVNHADLSILSPAEIDRELDENERLVNASLVHTGVAPVQLTFIRPPFSRPWEYIGEKPAGYDEMVARVGASFALRGLHISFNLSSTDAIDMAKGETRARNPRTRPADSPSAPSWDEKVARIRNAVLTNDRVPAGKGLMIIFHDTLPTSRDALAGIIDGLRAAGYQFGTLEDYSQWRWGRPSAEIVPGPALYNICVQEKHWGCRSFGVPLGKDRTREVCGRMWLTYESFGGTAVLGAPQGAPMTSLTGIVQNFERGQIEVYPQNPKACSVRMATGSTP